MTKKQTKSAIKPHAYVHRSHTSGDNSLTRDAYIAPEHGILIFRDGKLVTGTKQDIFENALIAKKLDKLEAFAILDTEGGLLLSQGTADTSYGAHKHKHPNGHQVISLHIPEHSVEYHAVWEESKEKLIKHKLENMIDKHLKKTRKANPKENV